MAAPNDIVPMREQLVLRPIGRIEQRDRTGLGGSFNGENTHGFDALPQSGEARKVAELLDDRVEAFKIRAGAPAEDTVGVAIADRTDEVDAVPRFVGKEGCVDSLGIEA